MQLLKRLFQGFGRSQAAVAVAPRVATEQSVTVTVPLPKGGFATSGEARKIHGLGDALGDAVSAAGAGSYEGEEFGEGECVLILTGPSADALHAAIAPVLRRAAVARGATVTRRYGGPGAPESAETI